MSCTIWKYELTPDDRQTVSMPGQAQILTVADQGGRLVMWARVDPDMPRYDYTIAICGTGHPAPEDAGTQYWSYVGTVLQLNGALVWHAFVLTELLLTPSHTDILGWNERGQPTLPKAAPE